MTLRLSGGRRLESPPGEKARPTTARVREAAMNLLAMEIRGASWLDLFSGSGAMACEALQRGATRVVAVEQDRRIAAVARRNLTLVQEGRERSSAEVQIAAVQIAEVQCAEVIRWLQRGSRDAGFDPAGFDLIYADPPYGAGLYASIISAVAAGQWLQPKGTLVLECPSAHSPETPQDWSERFRRRYGETTLLGLTPS